MQSHFDRPLDELIIRQRREAARSGKRLSMGRGGSGGGRITRSNPRTTRTPFVQPLYYQRGGATGDNYRTKLMISNLHYDVTQKDLQELFQQVGPVRMVALNFEQSGRSKGTASVVFYRAHDAALAAAKYNQVELDGRPMRIEVVYPATDAFSAASRRSSFPPPPVFARIGGNGVGRRSFGNDFPPRTFAGARLESSRRGGAGGSGRASAWRARGGGARGAPGSRGALQKSQEQLDKELDSYMNLDP